MSIGSKKHTSQQFRRKRSPRGGVGAKQGPHPAGLVRPLFLAALFVLLWACSPRVEILPPSTPPLSRTVLGYGVVTVSYTRVFDEPSNNGVVLGYVRERTVLTILERRLIREGDSLNYWVLTGGNYRGWLPESVLELYDNEGKAATAASSP
ncbi:MAG: hypothetical protein LBO65_03120 [Spirochaetaceae bacterium]|jgi:hypothetical protein|nr:hypothetical protein [Spirochaetaceae bacterium]